MQINWSPQHSEVLREYLARGMSFSAIAKALNARFNTSYSRNAALGRAKRMGLSKPSPPTNLPTRWPRRRRGKAAGLQKPRERHAPEFITRIPRFKQTQAPKLRCVELVPRHLSLLDLEASDCRYPYGGEADGEAITFCGHPRREDSSYCTPHFHLTRAPFTPSERRQTTVSLRLVKVA
jgi:GcrA cell cycle regulator